jgi:hypothetical protein
MQGDGAERFTLDSVAADELGGEVLGVCRAATIADG